MFTALLAKTTALYITGAPLLTPLPAMKDRNLETRSRRNQSISKRSKDAPVPGDVIYVKRMGDLYRHYGIYSGNNRVIHYAGLGGDWGDDVSIHEVPLREFLQDARRFTVCQFKTHCDIPGYRLYSREETLRRAYLRLGERNYNLITNNCEHFAVWCRTGISSSKQVKDAGRTICGVFDLVDLLME